MPLLFAASSYFSNIDDAFVHTLRHLLLAASPFAVRQRTNSRSAKPMATVKRVPFSSTKSDESLGAFNGRLAAALPMDVGMPRLWVK